MTLSKVGCRNCIGPPVIYSWPVFPPFNGLKQSEARQACGRIERAYGSGSLAGQAIGPWRPAVHDPGKMVLDWPWQCRALRGGHHPAWLAASDPKVSQLAALLASDASGRQGASTPARTATPEWIWRQTGLPTDGQKVVQLRDDGANSKVAAKSTVVSTASVGSRNSTPPVTDAIPEQDDDSEDSVISAPPVGLCCRFPHEPGSAFAIELVPDWTLELNCAANPVWRGFAARKNGVKMTPVCEPGFLLFGEFAVMHLVGVHEFGDAAGDLRSLLFASRVCGLLA